MTENRDMQDDNVDGDEITVGDVDNSQAVAVGRGASATVIIQQILKRKSMIAVLFVLVAIAAGMVISDNLLSGAIRLPSPRPKPATEGEALIIVLPFHVTASGSSEAHTLI